MMWVYLYCASESSFTIIYRKAGLVWTLNHHFDQTNLLLLHRLHSLANVPAHLSSHLGAPFLPNVLVDVISGAIHQIWILFRLTMSVDTVQSQTIMAIANSLQFIEENAHPE